VCAECICCDIIVVCAECICCDIVVVCAECICCDIVVVCAVRWLALLLFMYLFMVIMNWFSYFCRVD